MSGHALLQSLRRAATVPREMPSQEVRSRVQPSRVDFGAALLPSWCQGAIIIDSGMQNVDILMVLAPRKCSESVVNSRFS